MSKSKTPKPRRWKNATVKAIDLFCGVGGLTRGLEKAGIHVTLGVDIDPDCEYPYAINNRAGFLRKSVSELDVSDLIKSVAGGRLTLLAGCAPCQPFSTYQQKSGPEDRRWHLLRHFSRLAKELKPDLITMENVPNLEKQAVFRKFVADLKGLGFHVVYGVLNCADFGVPQQRHRLVLLASKLGPIALPCPRGAVRKTVKDAIGDLPSLEAGEVCHRDPFHMASRLSELNIQRIRASKPGGSWKDWKEKLVAKCHKRSSGKTYRGVYGRMEWTEPAPTITTQFYGFGNGRFGHPDQDRGISLREGAVLQSFPKGYKFVPNGTPIPMKKVGRLIGNAVPVKLAEAIGKTILAHVEFHAHGRKKAA